MTGRTASVTDPRVLLPRGVHRDRLEGVWKQGVFFYVGKLGKHDEGQGVGPLDTVSSVKKGHTGGHVNDTVGEEKFQYSVWVGNEKDEGSLAWMVSVNDLRFLHHLLGQKGRTNKSDRELKTLTEEGRAAYLL